MSENQATEENEIEKLFAEIRVKLTEEENTQKGQGQNQKVEPILLDNNQL